MLEDLNLDQLQDLAQARECIVRLLNLVEELAADNRALRTEVQHLRDELNRLKGEQGQPQIKPNQPPKTAAASTDHSSEKERHQPRVWKKSRKLCYLHIDRDEVVFCGTPGEYEALRRQEVPPEGP